MVIMSNTNSIRNTRAFVSSYLKSDSGKAALARTDIRVKNKDGIGFKTIYRSSAMAEAFQTALGK